MDQIWLASPSPALRLWPGPGGASWRLNPAAMAWGRTRQFNEASWRSLATELSDALAGGPERQGRLAAPRLRWRSLPMSTGWLVWLSPAPEPAEAAMRTDNAVAAAEAGLWRVDLASGSFEWDRQMFALHGLEDASAPDAEAYVDAFVHCDDRGAFRIAWQRALDVDVPQRLDTEFRIVRPDGAVRWIEFRSRRDARDGRDLLAGIAIDATDRIARRETAERAQHETGNDERAGAARSEILARMSHELRTPLNAVLGFAQLIEHDGTAVPVALQLDRVGRIREAGEELLRLVGDKLDRLRRDVSGDEVSDTVPSSLDGGPEAAAAGERVLSVLYIEDNPVNVILVEELVAMRPNTRLWCAVTGLAGVALAAVELPDVVLVDMQLPDIDGFEVLRRLRANRALDPSSLVALSANGMGDDIAAALAAGFDDYWTKPIDFRHFLNGLDALARGRSAAPGT